MTASATPNLNKALSQLQGELPRVTKTKTGKVEGENKHGQRFSYEYSYADLGDVVADVGPLLAKHGLAFHCGPTINPDDRREMILIWELLHESGEQKTGEWPLGPVNQKPQSLGSAITYGRRYSFTAATNIVLEDDDDGARAQKEHDGRQSAGDAWENATPARPRQQQNGSDSGRSFYRRKLAEAAQIRTEAARKAISSEAADAAKKGLCTPDQATHIQNRADLTIRQLKSTAEPVDVENLAERAGSETGHAEDEPGTVSPQQLTKLHTVLTGLGFGQEEREQKLVIAEIVIGRKLGGADAERSSKNLSFSEARKVIDTLSGMDRDQLIAYMAERDEAA